MMIIIIIANGNKKSFSRKKDHYMIILNENAEKKEDKFKSEKFRKNLSAKFPDGAEVLSVKSDLHAIVKAKGSDNKKTITSQLKSVDQDISFVSPLLEGENGDEEIGITPSIIVRIKKSHSLDDMSLLMSRYQIVSVKKLKFTDREFEVKISQDIEDVSEIFSLSREISSEESVEWTEPVFIVSPVKLFTPNDPLYSNQWHLHNTGQNGAKADADVDVPEGWNLSKGDNTVIAVIDDGVQLNHQDLSIYMNPGESGNGRESNGIDDDGNGYIDDYRGWNFAGNNNNPSPVSSADNHGTAVAGVAGAIGNNGIGATGSAINAKILPVKLIGGSLSCTQIVNAIRYAAKYSDVINNSWGGGDSCQNTLDAAIADAVNGSIIGARRGTKGTPVLFATGNSAGGWRREVIAVNSGTHTFKW